MVDLVQQAKDEGYAIIFITGRPATQEAATLGNLTADGVGVDAGYPAPTTLPTVRTACSPSRPSPTTRPTSSKPVPSSAPSHPDAEVVHDHPLQVGTRAHIESLGYEIVANFGDQFSDLKGGFADKTFKMPNPNYFLP